MEALEEKKRDSDEDPEISEDDTESEAKPSDGGISDEDWVPEATAEKSKQSLSSPSPATKVPETPPSTKSARPVEQETGSKSPRTPSTASSEERWHDENEADIEPPQPIFRPSRTPGPQLSATSSYTPLQLFQLFFSTSVLKTIIKNTNAYGAKSMEGNAKPWHDISMQDMYSYLALVICMGITKVCAVTDYWKRSPFFSLPLPASVMSCRRFLAICHALHLSDPDVDAENEGKRGTADFDRLCKIKPLYLQIVEACKAQFHPAQNIAVDERMVASKARCGLKQHMKNKPTKWGYNLFVLADSCCGYTWNFFVYEGKSPVENGKGLSYESVMALIDEKVLGTGYKLFVDNFYSSPMLFKDLLQKKVWACGTVRPNRAGVPRALTNDFPRNAPRGSLRWLRDNELLFVKWKDAREVMMCTTFHKAYKGDTVQKRVKGEDKRWKYTDVPIPGSYQGLQ
uniref:piggyBac transposable element-derived protein 4-like n=1 Tax=Centroberyx gerrardi TaxID=166262 RepID=UPI003AAFBAF3